MSERQYAESLERIYPARISEGFIDRTLRRVRRIDVARVRRTVQLQNALGILALMVLSAGLALPAPGEAGTWLMLAGVEVSLSSPWAFAGALGALLLLWLGLPRRL
ncbi:MAG: hypothetical protein ISN29_03145 [Gammaproteobacteria bacterium AqS3]|nr:hypothetical protein [Gammaproteobacteria bacterium AqS3]